MICEIVSLCNNFKMKHSTVSSSATMICANSTYFNFPGCDLSHSPLPLASILSSSQLHFARGRALSLHVGSDRVAPPCANAPHTHDRRPYFLAAAPFSSSLMPPPPLSLRRKSFPLWGPPSSTSSDSSSTRRHTTSALCPRPTS